MAERTNSTTDAESGESYQAFERRLRDRHAATYDDWYRRNKGLGFDALERSLLVEWSGRAQCVVDLGSGTGRITDALSSLPFTMAIDFSESSLRQLASKRLPRAAPVAARASAIPMRSGACDLVVSCQVLQHMHESDLLSALREAARVLRRDGRLLAAVYNRDYWRNRGVGETGDADHLYSRRFSADEFGEIAAEAGFRCVRRGYYKAIPDGGRIPARMVGGYAAVDRLVCRHLGRKAGCYLLYLGSPVRE